MNMPRIFVSGLLVLWVIETCSSTLLLLSTTTTLLLLPILRQLLSQPGTVAGLSKCSRVWTVPFFPCYNVCQRGSLLRLSLPVLSLEIKPDETPCKLFGLFQGTCENGRCVTSIGAESEGSFGSAQNSETNKKKKKCRRGRRLVEKN
uniref:Putative secreted protein n=1 Tax=Ixodes ricinus TaxID=34613 RepID=A0A0K8RHM2_IXORI